MAARPGGDGAGAARPGPGVWRRWVVRYQRYQRRRLEELQQKIRGLEDDNRQLREQLQHSQARVEELEGQVSFLRKQLQQCQEERSRWQQLEAELQQWHQELQELWESARYREEQLGAAQAELRALVAAQEKHLHNLEMEQRRLENRLQDLQVLIPPAPRKKINSVLTETRTGVQVNKCSVLGPSLQEGHRGA
ncbi:RUN and FYVE domain-containing protein 4-like isoform X3 [Anas acuta]|uniref:RUN and FYVE domain-containing protein 4-like isoform X3 n=1 Tax=Anas acuta TaxID=28680 RepID=UPI0035C90ACE